MRSVAIFLLLLLTATAGRQKLYAQSQPASPDARVIRNIQIRGNDATRREVILRELNVREGDTVRTEQLAEIMAESRRRLLNLALFTTVELDKVAEDSGRISLQIDVKERWHVIPRPIFQLADRNFNVWWTEMHRDLRRINAGLQVTDNNFRGNLESLTATVQLGYTQQLGIEYLRPYIDKKQTQGLGFSISSTQSGELAYATDSNKLLFARMPGSHIIRQYDGSITWFYRPGYRTRHSLTLGYHHADISDTAVRLNQDYFGNHQSKLNYTDLTYRVDYNGVDNWNYPLHGFKSINYLVLRDGIESFRWEAQWRTETGIFRQLHGAMDKWFVSAIARGRIYLQQDIPYYFQNALGTRTDYVRGYEYYVIDGADYGLLRLDLKYGLFGKNFKGLPFRYLPEVPLRIYPKIFADAGAAHSAYPGNSFLNDRLLYSMGIGLDIVTAYDFKIRIEGAVNHLGQYGLYLHLNSE